MGFLPFNATSVEFVESAYLKKFGPDHESIVTREAAIFFLSTERASCSWRLDRFTNSVLASALVKLLRISSKFELKNSKSAANSSSLSAIPFGVGFVVFDVES